VKTCPNLECPDRVERGIIREFSDNAEVCLACGARLVEAPFDDAGSDLPTSHPLAGASELDRAGDPIDDNDDLTCVLRTSDEAHLALVKSLLECESIEFTVHGEILQDFFGLGRVPGGTNYVVGPAEVLVRAADAPKALELLSAEAEPEDPGELDEPEDDAGLT